MKPVVKMTQAERREPKAIENRLLDRLLRNKETGCWEWQGALTTSGYGKMFANRRLHLTHRLACELFRCEIPDGLCVCHSCDNPPCCNPQHLFIGTDKDNMDDKVAKGRHNSPRGKSHFMATITDENVLEIRSLFASGVPRDDIAAKYGLHNTTITRIATGQVWKHLPGSVASRKKDPLMTLEQALAALKMKKDGSTFATIGKHFGVDDMVVLRAFRRHNLRWKNASDSG